MSLATAASTRRLVSLSAMRRHNRDREQRKLATARQALQAAEHARDCCRAKIATVANQVTLQEAGVFSGLIGKAMDAVAFEELDLRIERLRHGLVLEQQRAVAMEQQVHEARQTVAATLDAYRKAQRKSQAMDIVVERSQAALARQATAREDEQLDEHGVLTRCSGRRELRP